MCFLSLIAETLLCCRVATEQVTAALLKLFIEFVIVMTDFYYCYNANPGFGNQPKSTHSTVLMQKRLRLPEVKIQLIEYFWLRQPETYCLLHLITQVILPEHFKATYLITRHVCCFLFLLSSAASSPFQQTAVKSVWPTWKIL